jgi:hypothetical protein
VPSGSTPAPPYSPPHSSSNREKPAPAPLDPTKFVPISDQQGPLVLHERDSSLANSPESKICVCGYQNRPGAHYCAQCDNPLESDTPPSQ